ncbi:hypothetical protein ABIF31_008501 [Bradyrhizobium elkanii]
MKLLDLDVALEQRHRSCLNLLGQRLAQRILAVEQFGKRQQRPDEVGRLDHAGRPRHGLRDLIRKRAPAFRERSAQVDRCRRRYRCRLRHRCRRWCRLSGRCCRLRCWRLRSRLRLLFDGLASGPAAGQQDAERDNDQASRALRPSPDARLLDGGSVCPIDHGKPAITSPLASSLVERPARMNAAPSVPPDSVRPKQMIRRSPSMTSVN